jgi:hypothetical protein
MDVQIIDYDSIFPSGANDIVINPWLRCGPIEKRQIYHTLIDQILISQEHIKAQKYKMITDKIILAKAFFHIKMIHIIHKQEIELHIYIKTIKQQFYTIKNEDDEEIIIHTINKKKEQNMKLQKTFEAINNIYSGVGGGGDGSPAAPPAAPPAAAAPVAQPPQSYLSRIVAVFTKPAKSAKPDVLKTIDFV